MTGRIELRPLEKDDDRSGFSCGHQALDRFFREYAGQHQFKHGLSTTYVAVLGTHVLGFATVTGATIERAIHPSAAKRKKLPDYPLPVLRLARLGVDTKAAGRGIGKLLLRHVLELALDQRERLGCIGILVDAKDEAVTFYEQFGFAQLEGVQGLLPGDPTSMFLAIETVAAARE